MSGIYLFTYRISGSGCEKDVATAFAAVFERKKGVYMACANPHSLVTAQKDPVFADALKSADVLLPDGSGVILAAKVLGLPITEKVAGSDFFRECNKIAQERGGIRYFFLGSSQNILNRLKKRLEQEYPAIKVAGLYSPPYKDEFSTQDTEFMVRAVNNAKPDILWVGMTAPKQEKWIYQNKDRLQVPFIGAIGAVFDFYAGTKKRSSTLWINLGLEWLPRFLKEPRRLWKRNLKSTPIFLWWIFKEKLKSLKVDNQQ